MPATEDPGPIVRDGEPRFSLRRRTLAEGVLVEASIVVHLLKLRLLTLDAAITMLPPGEGGSGFEHANGRPGRLSDAFRDIDQGRRLLERARSGGSRLGRSESNHEVRRRSTGG